MKLAHLSDLHVLDLAGVPARAYANKRLLGYANIRFRRKHVHKAETAARLLRHVGRSDVDHAVITGDLTNLALETEFRAAREMITNELGFLDDRVSVVPGNHDTYVADGKLRPFSTLFGGNTSSDLPELALPLAGGHFPFVRLRGPLAIIGLSSAVPRLPFVAAGKIGNAQRNAFRAILRHPDIRGRTPVVLVHHPTHGPVSRVKALLEGLHDGEAIERDLSESLPAIILHGHLHRRILRKSRGRDGLVVVGATSASLHHHDADRTAGYNVYTFDDDGRFVSASAQVLTSDGTSFVERAIPEGSW